MSPRWLIAVPIALALGLAIGRYSRSPNVVTRDVVRTEVQYRDRVQTQIVHDVQTVHDVATQVRTVTVTKWAKAPDGSPVVTQETHAEQDRQAETKAQGHTQAQQQRETDVHQVTVETHVVEARPAWSASVLAGGRLGGRRLVDTLPAPLVVGVALERRILGPVSAGLWATSGMAGGLTVRVDW